MRHICLLLSVRALFLCQCQCQCQFSDIAFGIAIAMASLGRIALALGIAFAGGAFKPAHGLAFPTCNATGAFAVHQVAKPLGAPKTVNPPAVYAKALGKYGADVPAHVWTAAVTGSAATIPTEYETAYLTPVTVGGTTMYLIIDTGSADLYVWWLLFSFFLFLPFLSSPFLLSLSWSRC